MLAQTSFLEPFVNCGVRGCHIFRCWISVCSAHKLEVSIRFQRSASKEMSPQRFCPWSENTSAIIVPPGGLSSTKRLLMGSWLAVEPEPRQLFWQLLLFVRLISLSSNRLSHHILSTSPVSEGGNAMVEYGLQRSSPYWEPTLINGVPFPALNSIKILLRNLICASQHVKRERNYIEDGLTKQGVHRQHALSAWLWAL